MNRVEVISISQVAFDNYVRTMRCVPLRHQSSIKQRSRASWTPRLQLLVGGQEMILFGGRGERERGESKIPILDLKVKKFKTDGITITGRIIYLF